MESNSKGSSIGLRVRKGSWTAEEDFLLKKCIEKYGAGKWHQVPPRAGLNRCRKSCRLRWLNYLRPDIKRGCFTEDEGYLIIRLHKLLGNRWSLIAGRLPERTANDVKNYWNTHLQKRLVMPRKAARVLNSPKITKPTVIKPRPRAFSNNRPCLKGKSATSIVDNIQFMELNNSKRPLSTSPPPEANDDSTMEWWDKLFVELENNGEGAFPLSFNSTEEKVGFNNNMTGEWADKMIIPTHEDEDEAGASIFTEYQKGQKSCSTSDFCVDIDVWDLLSCDQDFLN